MTAPNIVLDAGYLYFNPDDADGNPTGEIYLAETPGFTVAASQEGVEVYSEDGPTAAKLLDLTTKINRSAKLSCKNMSADVLGLFFMADAATLSQATGTVTAESVNGGNGVRQGRYYQLGESASQPAGARAITDLVVKVGATAKTVATDYTADLALARIYIVPGGGIADDAVVTVDYARPAKSIEQLSAHSRGPVSGSLRYVSAPTAGTPRDLFIPRCRLAPDGELQLKGRDKPQEASFALAVQTPSDGRAALYMNGRAV